ncbi:MAG: hypothetical protein IIA27_15945 [Gemmatimonadetes bacterium]|nr:hypothetical protein [Gemmatimonadota bacterium]
MDFIITEDARIVEDQVVRFLNEKIIPALDELADQGIRPAFADETA